MRGAEIAEAAILEQKLHSFFNALPTARVTNSNSLQ
jgi:hypothetical protein